MEMLSKIFCATTRLTTSKLTSRDGGNTLPLFYWNHGGIWSKLPTMAIYHSYHNFLYIVLSKGIYCFWQGFLALFPKESKTSVFIKCLGTQWWKEAGRSYISHDTGNTLGRNLWWKKSPFILKMKNASLAKKDWNFCSILVEWHQKECFEWKAGKTNEHQGHRMETKHSHCSRDVLCWSFSIHPCCCAASIDHMTRPGAQRPKLQKKLESTLQQRYTRPRRTPETRQERHLSPSLGPLIFI